mgnify:CR=1 FL=1
MKQCLVLIFALTLAGCGDTENVSSTSPQGNSDPCETLNCPTVEDGQNRCTDGTCVLICNTGFEPNNGACININDCAAAPCQNEGVCVDGDNTYTCLLNTSPSPRAYGRYLNA